MPEPARAIVTTLQARGFQAYYAGGAVRDRLLGVAAQDFDVVTDARPEQVMKLFPRHSAVGAKFGVILVRGEGGSTEVATFRTEASYRDGRHPGEVRYAATPEEDVARRDFTINGLLMDPLTGEILDYVGGRADLAAGVVRAIGDADRRFAEDHLRMLRGVRFAARLGFTIEAGTWAAMQRAAGRIRAISAERVRDELTKMLTEGRARRAFELLEESGLLAEVLPEVARMRGVEQPPQYHPEGDVWTHTRMMLGDLPAGCPAELAWGVLLHDVGKPPTFRRAPDRIRFDRHAAVGAAMAGEIAHRLRFSGQEAEAVVALVGEHMKWPELPKMRTSTRLRFLRRADIERHLELLRLDCANSHGDLSLHEYARAQLEGLAPEQLRPPRLLTGEDLLAMGYAPGPQFRAMLAAVEDAQLEGEVGDAAAARAFVRQRFPMPH
jgi:poly(A) polymerase